MTAKISKRPPTPDQQGLLADIARGAFIWGPTHRRHLRRSLRGLRARGLIAFPNHRYELTPLGRALLEGKSTPARDKSSHHRQEVH